MEDKLVEGIKKIIDQRLYEAGTNGWSSEELAQKIRDSLVIDEDYLKDIIYCTTQHLDLLDKDVAELNESLADTLLKMNLIKIKE